MANMKNTEEIKKREALEAKLQKIKKCVERHSVNNHDPYHANLTELAEELDDILKGD